MNLVAKDFLQTLRLRNQISEAVAKRAETASRETNTQIDQVVLELGLLEESDLYRSLADHLDLPFLGLAELSSTEPGTVSLDPAFLRRVSAWPSISTDGTFYLASSSTNAAELAESVAFLLGKTVVPAVASPSDVRAMLEALDAADNVEQVDVSERDVERLRSRANDGPVVTLVNEIVTESVDASASDLHFEATEQGMRTRLRVDGALRDHRAVPIQTMAAVASRLKIMADLSISEKRRPQDGRFEQMVRGRKIDFRLSTLPTQFGESIVLRILDRSRVTLEWNALGFAESQRSGIRKILTQPNGIFLVSGPTGSGKTTTLYTALNELNAEERKIITIEDPIEYELEGVNQVQVNPKIDLTFASALRAVLRQDPNVVMVGEIRDEETAEMAVRSALIGRLVLSTIHTNDAVGAIERLSDLGVPDFLIASTLRGVLSQRLIRAVCAECQGGGCEACANTGQKGRTVDADLLILNDAFRELVASGAKGSELRRANLSS